ncbi:MAG: DUF4198 domain-containing protein [Pseudomonadota bacterium]
MVRKIWCAGALALVAAGSAWAHDFWIQPSSFWLAPRAATSVAILVGHGPSRQRWVLRLNRVVAFRSVGPGRVRADHSGTLQQGTYAPDATVSFAARGTHVMAFESTPAFNTLPPERFAEYLRDEGVTPPLVWRERHGATAAPGRESYSRRAKALVQVGPPGAVQPQVTRPLGMTLEIVPERNPYRPAGGADLPVRVIYEGRALPGALVKLTNLRADEKPVETHRTDGAGRAIFQLPRTGEWQLNVVWSKPVTGNPAADFETIFSSLSFGFPGTAPDR